MGSVQRASRRRARDGLVLHGAGLFLADSERGGCRWVSSRVRQAELSLPARKNTVEFGRSANADASGRSR